MPRQTKNTHRTHPRNKINREVTTGGQKKNGPRIWRQIRHMCVYPALYRAIPCTLPGTYPINKINREVTTGGPKKRMSEDLETDPAQVVTFGHSLHKVAANVLHGKSDVNKINREVTTGGPRGERSEDLETDPAQEVTTLRTFDELSGKTRRF